MQTLLRNRINRSIDTSLERFPNYLAYDYDGETHQSSYKIPGLFACEEKGAISVGGEIAEWKWDISIKGDAVSYTHKVGDQVTEGFEDIPRDELTIIQLARVAKKLYTYSSRLEEHRI